MCLHVFNAGAASISSPVIYPSSLWRCVYHSVPTSKHALRSRATSPVALAQPPSRHRVYHTRLCGADPSQPALTDDSARTRRLFAARGPRWAAQARHGATLGITAPVPRPRSRPARPWTGRARPPGGGPSRCCRTSAHAVSQCSAVTGT